MALKRNRSALEQDRRRKHHHWAVTLFYADGGKFERVYISQEKATRFAERQRKSPIVQKARVRQLS
jgi:hypothetical protein